MTDFGFPERSLATLLTELTRELATLFRQEAQLAKAEFAEKIGKAGTGLAAIVAGGLLVFVAVQALAAAAILGLSTTLSPWLAAMIVGAIVALVGGAVLARGLLVLRRDNLTPRRTIETLRDNTRWARERLQ
jgi:Putative Actinobacterial Holin-X, holin superfamily III